MRRSEPIATLSGQAIVVPRAVAAWRARCERIAGRGDRAERGAPSATTPAPSQMTEPGLQGYACVYGRPFIKAGKIMMFEAGCFAGSVYIGPSKSVLFDHDDRDVIGTTADGLEFAGASDGLVYRLPLKGNRRAAEVERGIRSGEKGCASVGCEIHEAQQMESAGVAYTLITKATLYEVSLVPQGAVSGTSASIVDLADEPRDLRAAARSASFKLDQIVSNTATSGRRLMDSLDRLDRLLRQG